VVSDSNFVPFAPLASMRQPAASAAQFCALHRWCTLQHCLFFVTLAA
jgi:hypothetical protein